MNTIARLKPGTYIVRLDNGFTVTVDTDNEKDAEELAERVSRMYADAIIVQDACNLSGVVHAFSRHMETLFDMGITDTDARNRHPISVLFSSKIASLTGSEDFKNFSRAYGEVKENVYKAVTS